MNRRSHIICEAFMNGNSLADVILVDWLNSGKGFLLVVETNDNRFHSVTLPFVFKCIHMRNFAYMFGMRPLEQR